MTTTYLSKLMCAGLLCILAIGVAPGNEVVPLDPEQMTDVKLVAALADPKWADTALSEIISRLAKSGYDPGSALAKHLAVTWETADEKRAAMLKGMCFQALRLVKSPEVVSILCRQLQDGNTRLERVLAARSLGQMGGGDAVVGALRAAIANDKGVMLAGRSIARASIFALGCTGRSATDALATIWGSESDRRWREEAVISAMGQTKDKRFIPVLVEVLQGQQGQLRDNAAWALGEIADDTALAVLRKYEKDPDANVRENVANAIGKIQASAVTGK